MDLKKRIEEMRQKKAELVSKMKEMLKGCEEARQNPSAEQLAEYGRWEADVDNLDTEISRTEKLLRHERDVEAHREVEPDSRFVPPAGMRRPPAEEKPQFRNFGEYLHTMAVAPNDVRLTELRLQQMGQGSLGGFAIPEQFRGDVLSVSPQQAIVRPRATVIPAGNPPDAAISMPALNQGAAYNMYGGVRVYHSEESAAATESTMALRQIKLEPHKLIAYMTASYELLNNWDAASQFMQNQMRLAVIGAEDYDFLRGTGVNQAQGILGAPGQVAYNRAGANAIAFADVVGMLGRAKYGGSLVWIASQTTIPQLCNIRDTGNNNLWMMSAASAAPASLAGFPLIYADRLPALGTKGDLCLCDFSYYLIKDGSGPRVSISEHFRFQNDEVCFKIVWYVDGRPWLTEPLPLEGAPTSTVSPFVVLDTP